MSRLFDLMHKPEPPTVCDEIHDVPVEYAEILPEARLVFHTDSRSPAADRYRFLRMRLRELAASAKLKTLLVTSPLPHDGKSTVCLNLATALAEGGNKSVLLMEADLHQPVLSAKLRLKTWPGLADCLEGKIDLTLGIRRVDPLNWYLLPAGGSRGNASELLQTAALTGVMNKVVPQFDWIIVDSPPALALSDATSLTRHADATLLVVRADQTAREAVDETVAIIGRKRLIGVVLNGVNSFDGSYSKYYKSYARYYSHNAPQKADKSS